MNEVAKVFQEAKESPELPVAISTVMNTSKKFMVVHTSLNINIGIENVDDGDRLLEFRFASYPLQYFVAWEDLEAWVNYIHPFDLELFQRNTLPTEKVSEYLAEHVRYLFDNYSEYFNDADDIMLSLSSKNV